MTSCAFGATVGRVGKVDVDIDVEVLTVVVLPATLGDFVVPGFAVGSMVFGVVFAVTIY